MHRRPFLERSSSCFHSPPQTLSDGTAKTRENRACAPTSGRIPDPTPLLQLPSPFRLPNPLPLPRKNEEPRTSGLFENESVARERTLFTRPSMQSRIARTAPRGERFARFAHDRLELGIGVAPRGRDD